jgi:dihydrofolate reductase
VGLVVVGATMSLDGFIAGPDDAMDWVFDYVGPGLLDEMDEEIIRTTGAVLSGRGCYDVGRRGERPETSGLYGGRWHGPEFVLTHHPPDDDDRPELQFLSGDIRAAVATASAAAGGRNLLVLGANVVGQCLDAGLVDEIRLHVAPIVLGDGVRLFGAAGRPTVKLQTQSVAQRGRFTNLEFTVVR